MNSLTFKMVMALNAADLGNPICEQAARICAEIADQHCAQLHMSRPAPLLGLDPVAAFGFSPLGYDAVDGAA